MAGIGFELRKIFRKSSIVSLIEGIGYSSLITIGPMVTVIGMLFVIFQAVDYSALAYQDRELLSSTILYVFIFSLLLTSPFNSVLSRYVADKIYEEKYEDILPSFYTGLVMNLIVIVAAAVPFYLWEYFVGGVDPVFVFGSFCMYISLALIFYCMLYLSATKDYKMISLYFLTGMGAALLTVVVLVYLCGLPVTVSVIYGMAVGFLLTAALEFSYLKKYFYHSSRNYMEVLGYFKKYYKLFLSNLFYTLGLFIHNFVFWFSPLKHTVVKSYISAQPYDMATCLAMFTNISVTVIFIVLIETRFSTYYKEYTENVTGGTYRMIEKAKSRMFRVLNQQIINIVQIQFIISMVIFLLAIIFLPVIGVGGKTMLIYPVMAAAYFVIFVMYCLVIFLYYFDDETGAVLTTGVFLAAVFLGSLVAVNLPVRWYGAGVFFGAVCGWATGYFRLVHLEKNFDRHIFCRGDVISGKPEEMPDGIVYEKKENVSRELLNGTVSIILPVHIGGEPLKTSVQSVIMQTYQNIELLLIDYSCLSVVEELCKELAESSTLIRVIQKDDEGEGEARNVGLMNAKGEHVLFLRETDWLDAETTVEKLLQKALDTRAEIIVSDCSEETGDGTPIEKNNSMRRKADNTELWAAGFFWSGELAFSGGKLYRRRFLQKRMISFRNLEYSEWMFNIECYIQKAKYAFLQEELYHYVRIDGKEKEEPEYNLTEGEKLLVCFLQSFRMNAEKKELRNFCRQAALLTIFTSAREEYYRGGRRLKPAAMMLKRCHTKKTISKNLRGAVFSKHTGKFTRRLFLLLYRLHLYMPAAFVVCLVEDFGGGGSFAGGKPDSSSFLLLQTAIR